MRCPNYGQGDVDHVLNRCLPAGVELPAADDTHQQPYSRYRQRLWVYTLLRQRELTDRDYLDLVARIDEQIANTDGKGFCITPLSEATALAAAIGVEALWIKDETRNVSGSHKARHLMATLLWLEGTGVPRERPLAIASCGNAALAAAVLAKAVGRPLTVYIPPDARPSVVERLQQLGATIERCPREGSTVGDPCYHRFVAAVSAGAIPFSVQGPDNALALDGGLTLGYEIDEQLGPRTPQALLLQVGGGALASSCFSALLESRRDRPRLCTVQTRSAFPLHLALERLLQRPDLRRCAPNAETVVDQLLSEAAQQRSAFMSPWPTTPSSVASGILDDETYDWLFACRGMLCSGGTALIAEEAELARAHRLAHQHTAIDVDPTGSAGLAGLLASGDRPRSALVAFTGVTRGD